MTSTAYASGSPERHCSISLDSSSGPCVPFYLIRRTMAVIPLNNWKNCFAADFLITNRELLNKYQKTFSEIFSNLMFQDFVKLL
jgi:hypothetical protein